MEKITLNISELIVLNDELEELIKEELTLLVKYRMNLLLKQVSALIQPVFDLKTKFIEEHGIKNEEGQIYIPKFLDQQINPAFTKFINEWEPLLIISKEIEYEPFNIADFSHIKSTNSFLTFFKLIK